MFSSFFTCTLFPYNSFSIFTNLLLFYSFHHQDSPNFLQTFYPLHFNTFSIFWLIFFIYSYYYYYYCYYYYYYLSSYLFIYSSPPINQSLLNFLSCTTIFYLTQHFQEVQDRQSLNIPLFNLKNGSGALDEFVEGLGEGKQVGDNEEQQGESLRSPHGHLQ